VQFCATPRESELTEIPTVGNSAQGAEKARKNSLLNYKSAALSGRVNGQDVATLYFSALGVASMSALPPSVTFFSP
jgi:hypothetical protein